MQAIDHFQKYHNTICLLSKFLHKHCFHFLMGPTMVPRENKNNACAKFWRTNKEYYGIFESGLFCKACLNVLASKTNIITIFTRV